MQKQEILDTLKKIKANHRKLYPNKTLYQLLRQQGINYHIIANSEYYNSHYNQFMCQEASRIFH